jgi:hypothetical protein
MFRRLGDNEQATTLVLPLLLHSLSSTHAIPPALHVLQEKIRNVFSFTIPLNHFLRFT